MTLFLFYESRIEAGDGCLVADHGGEIPDSQIMGFTETIAATLGRDLIDGVKKSPTFGLYTGQSVVLLHHEIYVMQQTAHERLFHDVDIVLLAVETNDRHSFYLFHKFLFDTAKSRSTFLQTCVRQTC